MGSPRGDAEGGKFVARVRVILYVDFPVAWTPPRHQLAISPTWMPGTGGSKLYGIHSLGTRRHPGLNVTVLTWLRI